ncbi:lysoplasmalogenase family protein [Sandarakinorhabdus sp.]|uniref:lysoplasmalogenase family protein n=1 Tax=Sandarakinorhabdus sp. TaxID=1916663 RepID=UPI003342888E
MALLAARSPLAGLPQRFLLLVGAALAAGLAYLLVAPLVSGWALAALKGSGVALLALAALQIPARGAAWLAFVLILGAAGDVLLELPGMFVAGAGSFAAGHVAAILLYARHRRTASGMAWPVAALFMLYGAAMPLLLVPAGPQLGGAIVYAVLLCAMAASLWLSRFPRLAALGAISFIASDTLLVLGMTGRQVFDPGIDGALVWASYFGGQWLITLGVARGLLGRQARAG